MITVLFAAQTAEKSGAAPFPPFEPWHYPSQIFWTVILFTLLYFMLSRFILPKLGSTIETRESTLADDLDEASRLSEEADDAQKAVEVRLAEARNKARETANKARAEVEAEISAETASVDASLAKKLAAAEEQINVLREKAMANVSALAEDATQQITARFDVETSASDAKSAVAKAISN